MNYTLEQKREAHGKGELWWRFPHHHSYQAKAWSLINDDFGGEPADDSDFDRRRAEYFIGPTPPRVLSELEGELLEALKGLVALSHSGCVGPWDIARAAIQKAEAQQ